MKQKILFPIIAVVLTSGFLFGASEVFAKGQTNGSETLVQRIAEKFHLSQSDVQAVFDDAREKHLSLMQSRFTSKLDQLVKDGKITDAQKQAILKKFADLQNRRQASLEKWKSMTPEERKKAKQELAQEIKTWEQQNGIDLKALMLPMGKGMMHKIGPFIR